MSRMIFVNLPTADLARSDRFYETIGLTKNNDFSDGNASGWIIDENIFLMVLKENYFATFLRNGDKPGSGEGQKEVLTALSAESREDVDETVARAVNGGGSVYRPATEEIPGMYGAAFADPDGHVWEIAWMDMAAMQAGQPDDQ
ncbi:VOC family protein [Zhihengliuella alba]|uniref:VOC family protein n=1 Tax=Zhihengliuella alba TaxID=547018 RepID=A0ABP7DPJ5_9MICC